MSDSEKNPQPITPHVPDPTAMTGTLETTGVGGGVHSRLEGVTEVFRHLLHTVEEHGFTHHGAPIVQGDTTGIPASAIVGTPVPTEQAPVDTSEDDETETQDLPDATDESDKGDGEPGAKTPTRRTAKKTASAPDAAKK